MRFSSILLIFGSVSLASVVIAQSPAPTPAADPRKPEWAYAVAPGAAVRGGGAGQAARGGGGNAAGNAVPGAQNAGQPAQPGGQAAAGAAAPGGRAAGGGGGGRNADPTPQSLPGSRFTFPRSEVSNAYGPADWFPEDHPPMPNIVAHGRQETGVRACAFCHMPNGKGRPENGPIAGLPAAYIVQQLTDFKSGARQTAEPRKPNDMAAIAEGMTPEDVKEASEYFASMKWTPWIRVVETDTVPTTRIAGQMFHTADDGTREPIGNRLVEAPEDEAAVTLRSPRSGFVAYVPVGAIKKGEAIVTTGGGKTLACTMCHGQDLRGLGPVPPLAGRGPSYLARQLYDIQQGTRAGVWSHLMKPVVADLTSEDMVNIFAYAASRTP